MALQGTRGAVLTKHQHLPLITVSFQMGTRLELEAAEKSRRFHGVQSFTFELSALDYF